MTDADAKIPLLLVDDVPANLLALEGLLGRRDVLLLKAASGEEALEALLEHEVALALIDVQMPGMDGFELAAMMHGSERTRHVPIIFVTAGPAERRDQFQGYEAGAVDFISKPIDPAAICGKVDVFLDLFRQRKKIAAQNDELQAAAKALREADRRKDRFLAVLGHELRNPVAALKSGSALLKRRGLAPEAEEIRGQMERMTDHLARLVDDLLDVARIQEGKVSLITERVDLVQVIRSAVEGTRHNISAARHRLVEALPSEAIWIDADHTRLAQAIANLLNNAAKYTPPGGEIHLSCSFDHEQVVIEVRDTGVGIPADRLEEIFKFFSQVGSHHSLAQGGLGIGLGLCRQLVGLHGGAISAHSSGANRGSTFRITLPMKSAATAPQAEAIGVSDVGII